MNRSKHIQEQIHAPKTDIIAELRYKLIGCKNLHEELKTKAQHLKSEVLSHRKRARRLALALALSLLANIIAIIMLLITP